MKATIKFASNELSRDNFPEGTTIGDILRDPNLRAVLGFGDNVEARIDGVTQDLSAPVRDGDVIFLATKAASKASGEGEAQVTVKFASNEVRRGYPAGNTIGNILQDPNLRAVLGFGDNVEARIDGVTQSASSPVYGGEVIYLATKAASKAG